MNFETYALIDAQIKELTVKKDALRAEMIKEMQEKGEEKIETAWGKFSVTLLKKWTYPETVLAIGESFKSAKALAESTGDATFTTEPSLRFTETKI